MTTGGNQAAITADVLGVTIVAPKRSEAERTSDRPRIMAAVRGWLGERSEARAIARSARDRHIELHWQQMHDDYSESWRWQANGF